MEDLLARLLEKIENRYYGKYRAFVVDNADPENRGRLRLRVPSILGNEVVSGWALPCAPYGGAANQGFFFIPEVDAGVWVEFEAGNLDYPVWVGTFWSKPGGTTEVPQPADGQSPPTSKMIKTLKHTIELADEDGSEAIKIEDSNGNKIILDSNGTKIEDKNGNKITLDSSGMQVEDKNSNVIIMDGLSGGIPGTNGIKMNGEKKVCLEGLITFLMSHTHIGNLGAPCPLNPADLARLAPLAAAPDGDILSKSVKLG
ncbi:MAG: phage baseplate assembly protein V [bacterium]